MIIEKAVQLELVDIEIRENPMNQRGKFVCYQFRMSYPSSYHFFKPSKAGSEDFSIIWGTSPTIEFLDKGHKQFSALVMPKIIADLPEGFSKDHVGNWRVAIGNYTSPIENREWCIAYEASTYGDKDRVRKHCSRFIPVDAEFIKPIIARLPHEITDLKVIRP